MNCLSFVEYNPDGSIKNGWTASEVKDWADGISEGYSRADEVIQNLRQTGDNPGFSRVMKDAAKHGSGAVLSGFLFRIADALKGATHFVCLLLVMI